MSEDIDVMDGMPVRSKKIEFDPSQLVACDACGRPNAPNRAECIYCGTGLPVGEVDLSPLKIREVEPWERAYNIILIRNCPVGSSLSDQPFDSKIVQKAIEFAPPMPLGRVETAEAAAVVSGRFGESGLQTVVVSDESLNASNPPVRLRSLSVASGTFVLTTFNINERVEFPSDALKLIVLGRLFEERTEQSLKKIRGGVKEIDGRSVSKDSGVLDLYFDGDLGGFRITESGFDFSGLGEQKSFLAAENMKAIIEQLRLSAPSAVISADYVMKRSIIEKIWPANIHNDSKGVQRAKFGLTVERAEVSINTEQFTKYSRLVRLTI